MSETKKIVAAIAFSKYAQDIFDFAARLATDLDARLVVANVINIRDVEAISSIESLGYSVDTDEYLKGIKEERLTQLHEIAAKSGFPKEKLKPVLKVGHPFDTLMKIIKEEDATMIVIGTKGRTDLEYVLLGSVAEKILRHSPIPVVSFRKKN